MRDSLRRLWLRAVHQIDKRRLRVRTGWIPGLVVDPTASSNLAVARYVIAPGARLRIGPAVATERRPGWLSFLLEPGAEVVVEEGAWLRTELGPLTIAAFQGARLRIGPRAFLNGCHLSAKRELTLGERAFVGPGTRIFDADQHDLDAEHPEQAMPVEIGPFAWIASDVTVLRGVRVGAHSVVGARSVVTRDVPPHTLAFGAPARARGPVGDRTAVR